MTAEPEPRSWYRGAGPGGAEKPGCRGLGRAEGRAGGAGRAASPGDPAEGGVRGKRRGGLPEAAAVGRGGGERSGAERSERASARRKRGGKRAPARPPARSTVRVRMRNAAQLLRLAGPGPLSARSAPTDGADVGGGIAVVRVLAASQGRGRVARPSRRLPGRHLPLQWGAEGKGPKEPRFPLSPPPRRMWREGLEACRGRGKKSPRRVFPPAVTQRSGRASERASESDSGGRARPSPPPELAPPSRTPAPALLRNGKWGRGPGAGPRGARTPDCPRAARNVLKKKKSPPRDYLTSPCARRAVRPRCERALPGNSRLGEGSGPRGRARPRLRGGGREGGTARRGGARRGKAGEGWADAEAGGARAPAPPPACRTTGSRCCPLPPTEPRTPRGPVRGVGGASRAGRGRGNPELRLGRSDQFLSETCDSFEPLVGPILVPAGVGHP